LVFFVGFAGCNEVCLNGRRWNNANCIYHLLWMVKIKKYQR
jgi:hypothetical protein